MKSQQIASTKTFQTYAWLKYFFFFLGGITLHQMQLFDKLCELTDPYNKPYGSLEPSIHDYPVQLLPNGSSCTENHLLLLSKHKICSVNNTTYYLKQFFASDVSSEEKNAEPSNPGIINHEEFNREFVRKNIGARVVKSAFFQNPSPIAKTTFYIASEIQELKHIQSLTPIHTVLSNSDIVKLAVTSTFINDLHFGNWGFDDKGLVLIDVDGHNKRPQTMGEHLVIASQGIFRESPPLSLDNVREMQKIYENMKYISLPKYHHIFHWSYDHYLKILDILIESCDKTIESINKSHFFKKKPCINYELSKTIKSHNEFGI